MLLILHSYANVDDLNGTLLICITKEKGTQVFCLGSDAVGWHVWIALTKLFTKVPQAFVLRTHIIILCSKLPFFLSLSFV